MYEKGGNFPKGDFLLLLILSQKGLHFALITVIPINISC